MTTALTVILVVAAVELVHHLAKRHQARYLAIPQSRLEHVIGPK